MNELFKLDLDKLPEYKNCKLLGSEITQSLKSDFDESSVLDFFEILLDVLNFINNRQKEEIDKHESESPDKPNVF